MKKSIEHGTAREVRGAVKALKFTELLKGKTIKRVEYFTDVEMNELGWHRNPAIIIFTDGTFLYGMRDDEGNDGGSIYYAGDTNDTNEIIHPI